jgi:hypothetical protein
MHVLRGGANARRVPARIAPKSPPLLEKGDPARVSRMAPPTSRRAGDARAGCVQVRLREALHLRLGGRRRSWRGAHRDGSPAGREHATAMSRRWRIT